MQPPLTITPTITKLLVENGRLIHRHSFQWSDRTNLSALVIRIELLDENGETLTQGSIQLPKTGREHVSVKEGDQMVSKATYDQSVYFYLDDIVEHKPARFRYVVVVGLFKKTEPVELPMSTEFEDLSAYH